MQTGTIQNLIRTNPRDTGRALPSTKTGNNHAGFGLAIVYTIVQNHEGWIEVESEVGEGTRFTLFFPVSDNPP